ncbi:hypothetical protein [Cyclobacterium marinum]|uniref:hypothetical protein n=1 Tax=Cyclobacterium marinum TaxID=104 RepID=UPI0011EE508C|nr:hypothetical protein [Cyclobacterium marinum]MBI0397899.1 hypothetical protein [Cyclobacterium marinum]
MKKTIIYFLLFGLSANYLHAEESDSLSFNEITLHVGYQNNYFKDEVFSPLNQQGNGMQFGLGYKRTLQNIFGVSLQYGSGSLNVYENNSYSDSYLNINLALEYLAKLPLGNTTTVFYLGGTYETKAFFLEWNDLDTFSYTSSQGFSIKGLIAKEINSKHGIETAIGIPIFQWLGRPPYNGIDEFIIENQDNPVSIMLKGKPSSFGKYLGLDWDLGYRYRINSRLVWYVNYSLNLQKVKDVHQFIHLSMVPSTGIAFKF